MPKKTDDIPVVVKPLAYYKMLIHVLRYGSKNIDPYQCKEVMGGLIGHVAEDGENKTLIIEDAIPVSHGGTIEVKFDEEQMVAFAEIDQMVFDKHGDKMWFACGWYHSHPNISPFFSGTDILNQLFWQNNVPHNVGIVFDHAYLDKPGDLGFRTFRLDDPSKGMNSKFHEVETKVEPPSNVEYYDKFRELIYHIQTNQPPIKELNETSDYLGDITICIKSKRMLSYLIITSRENSNNLLTLPAFPDRLIYACHPRLVPRLRWVISSLQLSFQKIF